MSTFLLLLAVILFFPVAAWGQPVDQTREPALYTPALVGHVTDLANVLSDEQRAHLTRLLEEYEQKTTHQIAILVIPSLFDESIESFSLRVAKAWGIGRADMNNGILVVLAPEDRSVRIELGLGFEAYISDARAAEIIDKEMLPSFREMNYAQGLENALLQLMKHGESFIAPE